MSTTNQHIDFEALVAAYLSGNATPEETESLVQLLKQDPELKNQYVQIKRSWGILSAAGNQFDSAGAWAKISGNIQKVGDNQHIASETTEPSRPALSRRRRSPFLLLRIAASIAILLVTSFSVYYFYSTSIKTISTGLQAQALELPDGSTVTLNRNSSFEHPRRFAKRDRLVKLTGEAFFDVAADDSKPFLIETPDNITITVVGTSFTVNTRGEMGQTQVVVATGVVEMTDNASNTIRIVAGEKGTFHPEAGNLEVISNDDPNYESWRTRVLIFRETPLDAVFEAIGYTYGTEFSLRNPELSVCTLTATFNDMSLQDVLEVIQKTFDVTYSRGSDNIVRVSGEGCSN